MCSDGQQERTEQCEVFILRLILLFRIRIPAGATAAFAAVLSAIGTRTQNYPGLKWFSAQPIFSLTGQGPLATLLEVEVP